ncbi:MAG: hypothetical protein OJF49_004664 [Ktedonobacterales bacterium]|nr:MAG: hypothetical protein OJF49_004664 [Ktedonobacterales bacterium]
MDPTNSQHEEEHPESNAPPAEAGVEENWSIAFVWRQCVAVARSGEQWFRANSLTPTWLPAGWRRPRTGYVLALLGQVLAALLMLLVIRVLPDFGFVDAFSLLGVVLAALAFGAGASLLATWFGALMLDFLDLPPPFSFAIDEDADVWGLLVFVAIGSAVSMLAGQLASARSAAEAARSRAEELVTSLTQANRRMDEFIGIASHELRTPLTTLKLILQLLERRATRDKQHNLSADDIVTRTLVTRASSAITRQERLVADLLEVSRIQGGKLELHLEELDLVALVRDCINEQQVIYPERTIIVTRAEQRAMCNGDPDQLRQALTNYLTNALKYSPESRPITVDIAIEGDVAQSVIVRVRDEGPGLLPEDQERIWGRFYRVPGIEVQSGSRVGLGLGLFITRQLIERHGGHVGVDSAPGAGAIFWFSLPTVATATLDQ